MQEKCLIVLPVQPIPLGEEYARGNPLPLHCTLMPWFAIPYGLDIRDVEDQLAHVARLVACNSIALIGDCREIFSGHSHDVQVRTLKRRAPLLMLHTTMFALCARLHCAPDSVEYVGASYTPHVSNRFGESFGEGQEVRPDRFVLIERVHDATKVVRQEFFFGGAC